MGPPPIQPGSAEWVYVSEPLSKVCVGTCIFFKDAHIVLIVAITLMCYLTKMIKSANNRIARTPFLINLVLI